MYTLHNCHMTDKNFHFDMYHLSKYSHHYMSLVGKTENSEYIHHQKFG